MNKKYTKYIHSFIALPFLTLSIPMADIQNSIALPNIASQFNTTTSIAAPSNHEALIEYRAALIDAYYASRDLPMAGFGRTLVEEAEKNDIDWRLLAAVAMRESTAGLHACGGKLSAEWNPWGWNSCKGKGFKSMNDSIEMLSTHLGGNHEKTAHYYVGKTTEQILTTYNPESAMPGYTKSVMKIMASIAPIDASPEM